MSAAIPALIVVVAQLVVFSIIFWRGRDWVIGTSITRRTFTRACSGECVQCDREEREWEAGGS